MSPPCFHAFFEIGASCPSGSIDEYVEHSFRTPGRQIILSGAPAPLDVVAGNVGRPAQEGRSVGPGDGCAPTLECLFGAILHFLRRGLAADPWSDQPRYSQFTQEVSRQVLRVANFAEDVIDQG